MGLRVIHASTGDLLYGRFRFIYVWDHLEVVDRKNRDEFFCFGWHQRVGGDLHDLNAVTDTRADEQIPTLLQPNLRHLLGAAVDLPSRGNRAIVVQIE